MFSISLRKNFIYCFRASIIFIHLFLKSFSPVVSSLGCSDLADVKPLVSVVLYCSLCYWMSSYTVIYPSFPLMGIGWTCTSGAPFSTISTGEACDLGDHTSSSCSWVLDSVGYWCSSGGSSPGAVRAKDLVVIYAVWYVCRCRKDVFRFLWLC